MTRGGARVRSGPPPDPNALRRDRDASEWTRLPAKRVGETPTFPLTHVTSRERLLWIHEWKRPQAFMWEAYGRELEVAFYVRTMIEAEKKGASSALRTLVIRQQDSLGLTTAGLRANRWIIELAEAPTEPTAATPRRPAAGARKRLEVLDGGA